MLNLNATRGLLRERQPRQPARVSYIELFFDLVFVYAIITLSHALLAHLTWLGAAQVTVLFLAVWWLWIYTTWMTNFLDPERALVRMCLFVVSLLGLTMAMAIPRAFEDRGQAFAGAYVLIQLLRTAFSLWALRGHDDHRFLNFVRILAWFLASAPFWIAGAFCDPSARLLLWILALAIEWTGPLVGFWLPGRGCAANKDWDVEGAHMAERCAQFVIIGLGESLIVTGGAFEKMEVSIVNATAMISAFVNTAAMWWLYFDSGLERSTMRFVHSDNPGAIAKFDYTYIHAFIMAGIVIVAVGDDLRLKESGPMKASTLIVMTTGQAVFLFALSWFKSHITGFWPRSHKFGVSALLAGAIVAALSHGSALTFGLYSTMILTITAVWEKKSIDDWRKSQLGLAPSRKAPMG